MVWERGDKVKIARLAKMSPGVIGDIFSRRRQPKYRVAKRVEFAVSTVLGVGKVSAEDIMTSRTTTNPLFRKVFYDELTEGKK